MADRTGNLTKAGNILGTHVLIYLFVFLTETEYNRISID